MATRTIKIKQTGVNTWRVGEAVIVRRPQNAKPFSVAGCKPRQMADCETLEQAVETAKGFQA